MRSLLSLKGAGVEIDWATLTRSQAHGLQRSALAEERKAADRFNESGSDEDEAAMLAAYTTWENLQVWLVTGERPEGGAL